MDTGHYIATVGDEPADVLASIAGDGAAWDGIRPAVRKLAYELNREVTIWHERAATDTGPDRAYVARILPDGALWWYRSHGRFD